jgi:hypothetical protein
LVEEIIWTKSTFFNHDGTAGFASSTTHTNDLLCKIAGVEEDALSVMMRHDGSNSHFSIVGRALGLLPGMKKRLQRSLEDCSRV